MKAWKDSASLILAARHGLKPSGNPSPSIFQHDYQLMSMKRHKNSKFMPGQYVFPGGAVDPADANLDWRKLYSECGFNSDSFKSLLPKSNSRPIIFKSKRNEIPTEISLRITAIRETFEECGVLLCKKTAEKEKSEWAQHLSLPNREIEAWQNKIHGDATEFYKLCENLQCYPDLWALHEWSNWMTPTSNNTKRFNTAFFLAGLNSLPEVAEFNTLEMEDLRWATPKTLISSSSSLPLPQYYEIARIAKFESLSNLLEFATERSKIGVQLQLPVVAKLKNGSVSLLPGDSMYPKNASLSEKQLLEKLNTTIEEFREMSEVLNRLEIHDVEMKKIAVHNFESMDGHMLPMSLESLKENNK